MESFRLLELDFLLLLLGNPIFAGWCSSISRTGSSFVHTPKRRGSAQGEGGSHQFST